MEKPEGLPKMEYRFLGRSGLKVSAISLGGWLTYGGHVDRGARHMPRLLPLPRPEAQRPKGLSRQQLTGS